jgi:hypothetical protein
MIYSDGAGATIIKLLMMKRMLAYESATYAVDESHCFLVNHTILIRSDTRYIKMYGRIYEFALNNVPLAMKKLS